MLLAEDLLLLLTDDRTGKLLAPSAQVDIALGGALLLELAIAERVSVAGDAASVRHGRLIVTDTATTSEPLLDDALSKLVAKQGKSPKAGVARSAQGSGRA
jgi:Golgi phosphoprotein 3 (GPP34)